MVAPSGAAKPRITYPARFQIAASFFLHRFRSITAASDTVIFGLLYAVIG